MPSKSMTGRGRPRRIHKPKTETVMASSSGVFGGSVTELTFLRDAVKDATVRIFSNGIGEIKCYSVSLSRDAVIAQVPGVALTMIELYKLSNKGFRILCEPTVFTSREASYIFLVMQDL